MSREDALVRHTEAGDLMDAELLRGFACAALVHDAAQGQVNDLLIEHIVKGRFHPSVVAHSLRPIIDELLDTMACADWQTVADELISDAKDANGHREQRP